MLLITMQIKLMGVFIVSGGTGQIPDDRSKELLLEAHPSVYTVVKANYNGRIVYIAEPETIIVRGRRIKTEKFDLDTFIVNIYEVKAELCNYYNDFQSGGRGMDTIEYVEQLLTDSWSYSIDDVGTWRFKAEAIYRGDTVKTPGKEAKRFWGIKPVVHRVSVRRNNSPVGWAESRKRLPYIWGNTQSQARLDIGTDCADYVAIAYERAYRKKILYPWTSSRQFCPGGLYLTRGFYIVDSIHIEGSLYYDSKGNIMRFRNYTDTVFNIGPFVYKLSSKYVEIGDVLTTYAHTTMLFKDSNNNGILDSEDLIIETLFDCPRTPRIGAWGLLYVVRYRDR